MARFGNDNISRECTEVPPTVAELDHLVQKLKLMTVHNWIKILQKKSLQEIPISNKTPTEPRA